jgi:DegV family protein with EDD domain
MHKEGQVLSRVIVVTDSLTCLPPDKLIEYGIRVAPAGLIIDGKAYRDQIDITSDDFWKRFKTMKQVSTSGALPGEFITIFKEAAKETDNIVCITLSKVLSVSYKSAVQARGIVKPDNPGLDIEVIDSKLVIGAEGFVVLEAARAAQAGKNMADVIGVAQDIMGRAKWVVGLRTAHTAKFGRAPDSVFDGNAPEVIPLIAQLHATGLVEDAGKTRGKEASFQRMIEIVGENSDASKPLHVMVHYTDNVEDGKRLLKMVKDKYRCIEEYLTPYSAVLGGSSGPATALAFYT